MREGSRNLPSRSKFFIPMYNKETLLQNEFYRKISKIAIFVLIMTFQNKAFYREWSKKRTDANHSNQILKSKIRLVGWTQIYMDKRQTIRRTDGQTTFDRFRKCYWIDRYNKMCHTTTSGVTGTKETTHKNLRELWFNLHLGRIYLS